VASSGAGGPLQVEVEYNTSREAARKRELWRLALPIVTVLLDSSKLNPDFCNDLDDSDDGRDDVYDICL
jgi:hypothetical protein